LDTFPRKPVMALNSVVFPTFGLPAIATHTALSGAASLGMVGYLHPHTGGLCPPHRPPRTTDFNLKRIPKRRHIDDGDLRARNQAHFHNSSTKAWGTFDTLDPRCLAPRPAQERHRVSSSGERPRRHSAVIQFLKMHFKFNPHPSNPALA